LAHFVFDDFQTAEIWIGTPSRRKLSAPFSNGPYQNIKVSRYPANVSRRFLKRNIIFFVIGIFKYMPFIYIYPAVVCASTLVYR
jgi:hypothetical protein